MNRQYCFSAFLLLSFLLPAACKPQEDVLRGDVDPGFALEGMFRYKADAALFRDCRNNLIFPVAMEAQYIELERAYLDSGIDPGTEVMIRLNGRLLERPAMEGDHNEVQLIVDDFKELIPGQECEPEHHDTVTDR